MGLKKPAPQAHREPLGEQYQRVALEREARSAISRSYLMQNNSGKFLQNFCISFQNLSSSLSSLVRRLIGGSPLQAAGVGPRGGRAQGREAKSPYSRVSNGDAFQSSPEASPTGYRPYIADPGEVF